MRGRILSTALSALVFATAACAATTPSTTPRVDRDVISKTEIDATPATTAYDLVTRLRPQWLRPGGTGQISGGARQLVTLVYVDRANMGGLAALRQIPASNIVSMRWYDATQATQVFLDASRQPIHGAIAITTR